ncbi:MAG: GNAT family N-acetyltransferase [Deltaproteobacteria bacterium]|nr:GNAT family N-acetyltransferase [Deltaproteobacteria bacterium]
MRYRVLLQESHELAPYVAQLRELERSITYPLADGAEHFFIDHGPDYHPFFSTMGQRAGFLLAFDGELLVGTFAGVLRRARLGDALVPSLYLADYKIRASHRGTGVAASIIWSCVALLREPELRAPRIFYGAAMRGARGDLMRSARGLKRVMRLTRPIASLEVFFADPARLAALDLAHAPGPPRGRGLDLSPDASTLARGPGIVSTAGRKDLRLVSSGSPFALEHLPLGPAQQAGGFGAYLKACGEALSGSSARACFAVDERLDDRVRWLRGQRVQPGARCTVYALRVPPARGPVDWVHLASSEI